MEQMGLKPSDKQVAKAMELHTILAMRHGVMVIGQPMTGKTSVITALAKALGDVQVATINPKAMTMQHLYGYFDANNDFVEGVFTRQLKEFSASGGGRKWIVLDGPIDAIWVENMNTVLDDNKVLLLPNGERIPLTPNIRLIYEVQDVAVASPATVSRCGAVYFDDDAVSWEPFIQDFLTTAGYPAKQTAEVESHLTSVAQVMQFMRDAPTAVAMSPQQHIQNFLRILKAQLKEGTGVPDSMLFAAIWSFGACLTERAPFDEFVCHLPLFAKTKLASSHFTSVFALGLIHEMGNDCWKPWRELSSPESEELVLTTDNIAHLHLMSLFAANSIPTLLVGPSATGKTASAATILSKFSTPLHTAEFAFSRGTTLSQLSAKITGVTSQAKGGQTLLFLDDINLPVKEVYGCIPVL